MNESDAMDIIRNSNSLVFTTREFSSLANISTTFASQMLRRLTAKGKLMRLYQGLWADARHPQFHAFKVVPFLTRPHPAALSLLSALNLHGMIEQIPQMIYVVSTSPTKKIKTPVGVYSIHQIAPEFFAGYAEYKGEGGFLIATPEKALVDCLYFSTRKGKYFSVLPELSLPKNFGKKRVLEWIDKIPYKNLKAAVRKRFEALGHLITQI